MISKPMEKLSNQLVKAFLKNKIIRPLPARYTKKLSEAEKFRKLCESKIKKPIIGFKAAGTGIPVLKKLKEKEPFYATVFKHNVLKNNKSVKINKFTMGIELEVCFIVKKNFFDLKSKISKKNSGKRQSSILSQRSRRSNNRLRQGIQGLVKRGADRKALMDFAIRNGAQRQTAVKLVNEILGEAASTPRAHLVQGGSASPR